MNNLGTHFSSNCRRDVCDIHHIGSFNGEMNSDFHSLRDKFQQGVSVSYFFHFCQKSIGARLKDLVTSIIM